MKPSYLFLEYSLLLLERNNPIFYPISMIDENNQHSILISLHSRKNALSNCSQYFILLFLNFKQKFRLSKTFFPINRKIFVSEKISESIDIL